MKKGDILICLDYKEYLNQIAQKEKEVALEETIVKVDIQLEKEIELLKAVFSVDVKILE